MNIGYIKKQKYPLGWIEKIKYFLGMISSRQYEVGYVFQVPLYEKEKKMDKVIKRLMIQMQKAKIEKIVFSDECICYLGYPNIVQICIQNGIEVLNGRQLMRYMDFDILKYILKLQNIPTKQEDVFFLIKKENNLDLQFLSRFIENCKTVNIVTNDLKRFKKVQETLYEKESILISVSNHKTKSLKRAKYIFNVNMDLQDLEKYTINRNSIIIHLQDGIKYQANLFNGINVNGIEIDIPDEVIEEYDKIEGIEKFNAMRLYESILLRRIAREKRKIIMLSKSDLAKQKNIVADMILEDGIKIKGLIGNNGKIAEAEIIQNYQKILDYIQEYPS